MHQWSLTFTKKSLNLWFFFPNWTSVFSFFHVQQVPYLPCLFHMHQWSLTLKKKNHWTFDFFFPIEQVSSTFSMYNKCLIFLVYFTCNNGLTKSNPNWINHAYYWAIVAPNWSCLDLNIFFNQDTDIFYFIWILFKLLLKEYSCWIQDNGVVHQHEGGQHKCQKMW